MSCVAVLQCDTLQILCFLILFYTAKLHQPICISNKFYWCVGISKMPQNKKSPLKGGDFNFVLFNKLPTELVD